MSKYQEVLLNRLQQLKAYIKESRLELLNQDYLEKEIGNIYEATQQAVEKANKYDNIIDNVKKDIENIKENTSNLDENPLRKIGVEILENVLEYGRRK